MKLKYYLRGLGIGIICTAIIMGIALSGNEKEMSDAEIITRAEELGMVMEEETSKADEPEADAQDMQESQNPQAEEDSEDSQRADENSQDSQETGEDSQDSQEEETAQDTADASGQETDTQEEETAEMVELVIESGDYSDKVCRKLVDLGLISDAEEFNRVLVEKDIDHRLRVGSYQIPKGASEEEIAEILQ